MGKLTLQELKDQKYKCTDQVVSDLKAAFKDDLSNEEACHYAKIHPDTYYEWRKLSDEFSAQMDIAKSYVARRAKQLLAKAIENGGIDEAKWYLERRQRKDYSSRIEQDNSGDISISITKTITNGPESSD